MVASFESKKSMFMNVIYARPNMQMLILSGNQKYFRPIRNLDYFSKHFKWCHPGMEAPKAEPNVETLTVINVEE